MNSDSGITWWLYLKDDYFKTNPGVKDLPWSEIEPVSPSPQPVVIAMSYKDPMVITTHQILSLKETKGRKSFKEFILIQLNLLFIGAVNIFKGPKLLLDKVIFSGYPVSFYSLLEIVGGKINVRWCKCFTCFWWWNEPWHK